MRPRITALAIASLTALAPGLVPAAAVAGPPAPSPTATTHCVAVAVETTSGAIPPTPAPRCFDDLASAVDDATGGAVTLNRRGRLKPVELTAFNRASERPIIGIEYTEPGFRGSTYVVVANRPGGCDSAGDIFTVGSVPSAFNDTISSARSYTGCLSRHYSGASLSGTVRICTCTSMGAMDNRTSSIRFSAR